MVCASGSADADRTIRFRTGAERHGSDSCARVVDQGCPADRTRCGRHMRSQTSTSAGSSTSLVMSSRPLSTKTISERSRRRSKSVTSQRTSCGCGPDRQRDAESPRLPVAGPCRSVRPRGSCMSRIHPRRAAGCCVSAVREGRRASRGVRRAVPLCRAHQSDQRRCCIRSVMRSTGPGRRAACSVF